MLRLIRHILFTGLGLAIVIGGVSFGVQNNDALTIKFLRFAFTWPVYATCLAFFGGGAVLASLFLSTELIRLYSQNLRMKRQLRRLLPVAGAAPSAQPSAEHPPSN